jgi:hypothetical protein
MLDSSSILATIYTRAAIWDQVGFQPGEYSGNLRLLAAGDRLSDFFEGYRDEINRSHLVLFNTLASNFRFFLKFDFEPPTILRIHNANTFGRPWASYSPLSDPGIRLRDVFKIIRNSFRAADIRALAKVVERTNYLMFPNSAITEHVIRERMFDESKVVRDPFSFSHTELRVKPQRDTQRISIAVPGSIDPRRRDYRLLVGAFQRALPRFERFVELVLLGSPKSGYARKIVARLRSLENDKFRLVSFDRFVPNEVFETYMDKADFLVLPIGRVICYKGLFLEQYGYTKASGNIDDMVRFGVPAILPASYPLERRIRDIAATYSYKEEQNDERNESNLAELVVEWVNKRSYQSLDVGASLSENSLEKMSKKLERTLGDLLARTSQAVTSDRN